MPRLPGRVPGNPRMLDQEFALVDISTIEPHPDNPNVGDVEFIGTSIQENGFYGSVTVQKSTRRILVGEHRWRGAKLKGAKQIWVGLVDVDDVRALKIMLVDNESAKRAHYDQDVLDRVLESLDDLAGSGFEATSDLEDLADEPEEDDLPEPPEDDPLPVQYGVIVMCADESEQELIFKQMTEEGHTCRVVSI